MKFRILILTAMLVAPLFMGQSSFSAAQADEITVTETDWAWWRGPNRNGVAEANQTPPLQWDDEKNILWKSPVPGRGYGSPIVVGDKIFLATSDEEQEIQSVLCYDRNSGKQLWKTDVHTGGTNPSEREGNPRWSKASSTAASDGQRVFINFFNSDAVFTTALSLDGKQLWQKKVCDYAVHQGYGSSPAIYGPLVIVGADNKGGGVVTGFDRVTGNVVWTTKRAEKPNYASPIILHIDGKDQLVFSGQDVVSSYDPLTGEKNWEFEGATTECVTSVVTDGKYVVTSGGYPSNHIAVVRADASGEVVWRNETRVYVPSMLVHAGHLYGVTDSGEAFCYALDSETPLWEERLRAKFSASLVLVGEHIFATSEKGSTFIFKANPTAFELVQENTIEVENIQATPAICDSKIYMRVTREIEEEQQEMLYCIGQNN